MKPVQSHNYDAAFPEKFDWSTLESPIAARVAMAFSRSISEKMESDRSVPGLRIALNEIAEKFDIKDSPL